MVPFTSNYRDRSNSDGFQFEFFCQRCRNGHTSSFQRSITGFGGKLLQMGGGLLGGQAGAQASRLGRQAQGLHGSRQRGAARDKALAKAVEEVSAQFEQCGRCGTWVCGQVCWNGERGLCVKCAPKLGQEVAGMQAEAQRRQLNERIREQDWTRDVNYREQATGNCGSCGQDAGGGRFCRNCGAAQASAPTETRKFCTNCGTDLGDARFCGGCGWPAG
ncbi:hypothetical protein [Actinomadura sp. GC306]|uniref:hypothetical protein n=1 Tax=Actinomadura sp. GC306 TaxID=2530367 RepID=UPI001FB6F699|nr:hypothetical protein [Actinomadura sp. GC306]